MIQQVNADADNQQSNNAFGSTHLQLDISKISVEMGAAGRHCTKELRDDLIRGTVRVFEQKSSINGHQFSPGRLLRL